MSLDDHPSPEGEKLLHKSPWTQWVSRPWGHDNEEYYCLKAFDYVNIVAITPERELLLVQQFRPATGNTTTELPSGLMDIAGESPRETIHRELLEETGYRVKKSHFAFSSESESGRIDNKVHVFFSDQLEQPSADWIPENGVTVQKMPLDKACDMIQRGELLSNIMHLGAFLVCKNLYFSEA